MNPNTGELFRRVRADEIDDVLPLNGTQLQREAIKALAGVERTTVDLNARTPLAAWAKKKRRAKIAAESKRRNRSRK